LLVFGQRFFCKESFIQNIIQPINRLPNLPRHIVIFWLTVEAETASFFIDTMHHVSPTSSTQLDEGGYSEKQNLSHGYFQGIIHNANKSNESNKTSSTETPTKATQNDTENPCHRVTFSSCLVTAVKTRPRTRTEEKPNLYWTANEIASIRCHEQGKDEKEAKFSNDLDESDLRYLYCRIEKALITCHLNIVSSLMRVFSPLYWSLLPMRRRKVHICLVCYPHYD